MPGAAPWGAIVWPTAMATPRTGWSGGRCIPHLTDDQWAVIAPLIPVPTWIQGRGGRPEGYCHREMIDAMLYIDDNGTKWRALPADYPDWTAAYRFFRRWRDQGLLTVLHDRAAPGLSCRGRARTRAVRSGERLAVVARRGDRRRGRSRL